jgi:hypothetical protein
MQRAATSRRFFHAEPFDVACDLADHQLNVAQHLNRYLRIRDKE